jgi:6-pyruvoyl-tetrahydropterin synthase-like protein
MSSRAITMHSIRGSVSWLSPETKQILWVVAAALAIMSPTLFWGMPSSRDLTNHFRFALPFYDSLRAGHFYPGWLAESNSGYGDASFRFYPPAVYYLLAFARTLTGSWLAGTLLTANVLSVTGALGVYFWARAIGAGRFATWAAILFAITPYHLNQFFQSFMLAEFAGAAVLPFAFAFTERVCRGRRPRDIAGLAAAYAILVLTHLPLAVIASIALLVYAILRFSSEKRLATLGCLGLSVLLGLFASASYWTTMVAELRWIRADNLMPDPSVDYRQNFVLSTFSPDYLSVWWMNILLLAMALMFWPALALMWKSARKLMPEPGTKLGSLKALTGLLLLTLFMATPVSQPLWNRVQLLQQTQFPWRWFAILSMVCPLLLAMAIPFWQKFLTGKRRPLAILAAGTAAVAFAFSVSHIIREAYWLPPQQFEQRLNEIPGSQSVSQWLPVWVHEPIEKMDLPVEAGDRKVTIDSWQPERRVFELGAGASATARVRTFFYPHWVATSGNQQLATSHDRDGAILIALPPEGGKVTLEFREPRRVHYAAELTVIGWLLIGLLLLRQRPFAALLTPESKQ